MNANHLAGNFRHVATGAYCDKRLAVSSEWQGVSRVWQQPKVVWHGAHLKWHFTKGQSRMQKRDRVETDSPVTIRRGKGGQQVKKVPWATWETRPECGVVIRSNSTVNWSGQESERAILRRWTPKAGQPEGVR